MARVVYTRTPPTSGTAIDLFAGAGGVTAGLKAGGATVLAAVELDPVASMTYAANHPEVRLLIADIRDVDPISLLCEAGVEPGDLTLLSACAPCQGYSSLGSGRSDDPRNDLVLTVLRFVAVIRPLAVTFENVPLLARDPRFIVFVKGLCSLGYGTRYEFIDAANFRVPQRRRRLVVRAARGLDDGSVPELKPTNPKPDGTTVALSVRQAFASLPRLDSSDPIHVSRSYPPDVLARIRAVPKDGGSRRDLPDELWLQCHRKLVSGAASAYGRMRWDDVAPTLTTRCTSPSCGRFLHPEEDRAITLREAAAIQTFPSDYQFAGGRMAMEAQIGNAVPVRFAEALWEQLTPGI